jgi:hypothetical protein
MPIIWPPLAKPTELDWVYLSVMDARIMSLLTSSSIFLFVTTFSSFTCSLDTITSLRFCIMVMPHTSLYSSLGGV